MTQRFASQTSIVTGAVCDEGTPEDVAAQPTSYTGQYLQRVLIPTSCTASPSRNEQPMTQTPLRSARKPSKVESA